MDFGPQLPSGPNTLDERNSHDRKTRMPKRNDASTHAARGTGQKISHTELEARRDALLKRLQRLSPKLRANRGYASARSLLGASYMRANLTARLAVLQTAQFMISVLEMLPPM